MTSSRQGSSGGGTSSPAAGWTRTALEGALAGVRVSGRRQPVGLPHLLAEVEGIAEGANADPDAVFATNCLDEAWWWGEQGSGCSAVAFVDRGPRPIIGQNMDLDTWMDTTQVALRLQPSEGPAQVLLSRAGMVGLCGANEAGVGVVVNTLDTLPSSADGLPVAFVIRLLARADVGGRR